MLPENWDAVRAFMRLQSKWDVSPMGVPMGIKYDAAEIVMRRLKVADEDATFWRLQAMEFAVLNGDDDADQ